MINMLPLHFFFGQLLSRSQLWLSRSLFVSFSLSFYSVVFAPDAS